MEICTNDLESLRKQESELIAQLEVVRLAIQAILSALPAEARGGVKFQEPADATNTFMKQVLAELGGQFSSVDIFQKAKFLKPDFDRKLLEKSVNRLQRTGAIRKIESGRGWRPARFQKMPQH